MKYRTIVADPPWEYPEGFNGGYSITNGVRLAKRATYTLEYNSLSVAQIASIPVHVLAHRDCRLFLWATNRYLPESFGVLSAWGFKYSQTLTWKKLDGIGGAVAHNSEFLIVSKCGSPALLSRLPNAVIEHSQPKQHSRKPDVFLDLVEKISPGPYLELFARRQRLGWDTWGDQALEHVCLA